MTVNITQTNCKFFLVDLVYFWLGNNITTFITAKIITIVYFFGRKNYRDFCKNKINFWIKEKFG